MRHNIVRATAKSAGACVLVSAVVLAAGCAAPSFSRNDFPVFSSSGSGATGSVRQAPTRLRPPPRQAPSYQQPAQDWGRSGGNYGYNYDAPAEPPRLPKYAKPDTNRSQYKWNGTPPQAYPKYSQQPRSAAPRVANRQPSYAAGRSIRVAPGDTLYGLSERHRVSMAEVMRLNNLHRPDIQVGQQLRLPPSR